MKNSLDKAFTVVAALSLTIIAVELVPFSREKELTNLCREFYVMELNNNEYTIEEKKTKVRVLSKKTGLSEKTKNIKDFCNTFYFNQNLIK
tara:strand:+ start:505 stop:777 length:273 start_codon:yes stop_codon:yes gene_type:complete